MNLGPRNGMKHSCVCILQESKKIYSYRYSLSATHSTDMYRHVQDKLHHRLAHPTLIHSSARPLYQKADLMVPRVASCLICAAFPLPRKYMYTCCIPSETKFRMIISLG